MSSSVPFFYDTKKEVIIELVDGMVVGRNKDCDVPVIDHRVSGMHFKIKITDDEVFLIDLESSNKTKHNGDEIDAKIEIKLSVNDNIKFGDQKFLYFFENTEEFVVPEVTTSMKINSTADCAEDLFQSSELEVVGGFAGGKKKTKVSELKIAKENISEVNTRMLIGKEEVEDFISLKQSYDELIDKISNSKEQLNIAKYSTQKEVQQDIKNYDFSISELNESINDAKQKIEGWSKQIAMINQSILEAKHFNNVFENLSSFNVQEEELKNEIDMKTEQKLEENHLKLVQEHETAQELYKKLQSDYSNTLGLKMKRSA